MPFFSDFIDKNISIEDLIENFNENCKEEWKITKYNEFKIYFPYQIMIDMTKEIIVNKIVKYLNNIISNVPNVNSIIYAGSVSSNPFIISMIKEELGYNINHYLCTFPAASFAFQASHLFQNRPSFLPPPNPDLSDILYRTYI